MLTFLKYLFSETEYKPVLHSFLRSSKMAEELHENGYIIADLLKENEKQSLRRSYEKHYKERGNQDGEFFGEFSKDIHDEINDILNALFNELFYNYKSICSAFVIKTPGKSSRVPFHQDSAAIDETKYSSLNLWIPLQTINDENGALHVIPKTHKIFLPYRSATIEPYTSEIQDKLTGYFKPLYLEFGQVLFLDSRIFHYSPANLSEENRAITVCRICPSESNLLAYYKAKEIENAKIEVWKCPDDYLLIPESHNDTIRPQNCEFLGYKEVNAKPISYGKFKSRIKKLEIMLESNSSPID